MHASFDSRPSCSRRSRRPAGSCSGTASPPTIQTSPLLSRWRWVAARWRAPMHSGTTSSTASTRVSSPCSHRFEHTCTSTSSGVARPTRGWRASVHIAAKTTSTSESTSARRAGRRSRRRHRRLRATRTRRSSTSSRASIGTKPQALRTRCACVVRSRVRSSGSWVVTPTPRRPIGSQLCKGIRPARASGALRPRPARS